MTKGSSETAYFQTTLLSTTQIHWLQNRVKIAPVAHWKFHVHSQY